MVNVELCQVVRFAATKAGIFFEQTLLNVEAKVVGFVVVEAFGNFRDRVFVDLAVFIENFEQGLAAILGLLRDQLFRPDILDFEAFRELHDLPDVRLGFTRCIHLLAPELGTAFRVTIGAFFLDPHGGGQDQVSGQGGDGRIGIRNGDEVVGVAITRPAFFVDVRRRLKVVGTLNPVTVQVTIFQFAVLQHSVEAGLARDGAFGQAPFVLGKVAVRFFHDHHVGGQTVGKGANLTRGTTGRRLTRQREGRVARLGDFADQQVHVVHQRVHPGPAGVLVEAHGPERHHLAVRVSILLGQTQEVRFGHTREFRHFFKRVFRNRCGIFFEGDRRQLAVFAFVRRVGCGLFQRVVGAQTVADVGVGLGDVDVVFHELFVHRTILDDVVRDVVQDRQVGLRREDHAVVGQLERAVLKGRQYVHFSARLGQAGVGQTRPQDWVHLGHVRTPEHKGVCMLEVVIAAHRFVDTKGPDERSHGRGHAVTCVGVDVVRPQTGLHELGSGIAFPDSPLTRAEHGDGCRAFGLDGLFPLLGHHIKGFVPGHRLKLAVFVKDTV